MIKPKICVVSGTRAEYGLLKWVIKGIKESKRLNLQLVVTGMHLSPEFGLTYMEIENDGFCIDEKLEILISSDTPMGISKSVGLGVIGFSDVFKRLNPDLLVLLGDRYEIFSAASAAMIHRIPIAHLHGGESTEGLIDEPIRHSITKMSHLHFVSTKQYQKRVAQLGEQPKNIHMVGGLGVDSINKLKLLNFKDLEEQLNFKLGKKNLLITFHPVTLDSNSSEEQMNQLLSSLKELIDVNFIFTMPNADTDGRILIKIINKFVNKSPLTRKAFTSLGQLRYLSCIKHFNGVVGNSSSGLLEVPTFRKGTVNIGDRQRGRVKAKSVIDCNPEKKSISKAIQKLFSSKFQNSLNMITNPYGNGGASEKIIRIIENTSLSNILKKKFYDLKEL